MTLPATGRVTRRRTRRTAPEVKREILLAARAAFAAEGYTGAATRRIAAQADCAETLIFRHFGSKGGLYRSAVLSPARGLTHEFEWQPDTPLAKSAHDVADNARAWVGHVLTIIDGNRSLLSGFLNHGLEIADEPELTAEIRTLRRGLFRVLDQGAQRALDVGTPSVGLTLAVRSVVATHLSVAAYSTLFEIPGGIAYARTHREELVRLGSISLLAARGR